MLCFIKWKGRNTCLKFNLFGIAKGYLQVWNKNALQWRNVWTLNKKERTILEKGKTGQTGVLQLKDSILASNLRLLYKKVETTNKYVNIGKLREAQLVRFLVVESAYPGPVDSETFVVTLSISRFAGPIQFFGGAHRGMVCVRAFVGWVCPRVCEHLRL
jgi:hypothetical protein